MASLWNQVKQSAATLAGNWASFVAIGSFGIYVLGYLVIRFHLTVFGIGTDLAVLDERYLFAGTKLIVYLISSVPILVFLGLILILIELSAVSFLFGASWLLHKIFPKTFRVKTGLITKTWRRTLFLCAHPQWIFRKVRVEPLAFVGIVFSVLLIQFVMRQCFLFHDLLLAPNPLPPPIGNHWFTTLLLDQTGNSQYYYFSGLVIGNALSLWMYLAAKMRNPRIGARGLVTFQGLLVILQFLFLPINYGILVFDKAVPRVESLGGQQELKQCVEMLRVDCQEAWLVWEGAEGETYLVRYWQQNEERRTLITFPRKDRKKVEILRYDYILPAIYSHH